MGTWAAWVSRETPRACKAVRVEKYYWRDWGIEECFPTPSQVHVYPEPEYMTLFGTRILAEVIG